MSNREHQAPWVDAGAVFAIGRGQDHLSRRLLEVDSQDQPVGFGDHAPDASRREHGKDYHFISHDDFAAWVAAEKIPRTCLGFRQPLWLCLRIW